MVTASRAFVCVRPATYESAAEGKLLLSLFRGRLGNLENSVFALLSPDGKERLTKTGRSPGMVFKTAAQMAERLTGLAQEVGPKRTKTFRSQQLPAYPTLRLALNVAACDDRPLIVRLNPSVPSKTKKKATDLLIEVAWSDEWVGRVHYAHATAADVRALEGMKKGAAIPESGYVSLSPAPLGQGAELLGTAAERASKAQLEKLLQEAVEGHKVSAVLSSRDHVRAGKRAGVSWETVIPVTDPGRLDKDRARRRLDRDGK
ncbi:MAG TPA: hypothetical protein EYQ74_01910 [Planctomycetes bacterium]|nr:hypothetical protein [Planctomycetota bacterium]HIK61469.1 hypothetical protein [Planctomycetota bacterium]